MEVTVPIATLASILNVHVPPDKPIDFMTIDTEGAERLVLAGNDWSRWKPPLLVIEYAVSGRDTTAEWEALVLAQGYRRHSVVGCNVFYALRMIRQAATSSRATSITCVGNSSASPASPRIDQTSKPVPRRVRTNGSGSRCPRSRRKLVAGS